MHRLNRRDILKITTGAAAAGTLPACVASPQTPQSEGGAHHGPHGGPLNVIVLTSAHHAASTIGAFGGPLSAINPTPMLDILAQQGTLLKSSGQSLDPQALAKGMQDEGYHTATFGSWYAPYGPEAFDAYQVLERNDDHFDPLFWAGGVRDETPRHARMSGHATDAIASSALDWLTKRDDPRPFFAMLSFNAPQALFDYAPRYQAYLADVMIPEQPDIYANPFPMADPSAAHHLDREYTHEAYQASIKAYLRCVRGIDDTIARLFGHLRTARLWDRTAIFYTSDFNAPRPDFETIVPRWIMDEAMGAPLIIRDPRMGQQAQGADPMRHKRLSDIDPTSLILSMAGAQSVR